MSGINTLKPNPGSTHKTKRIGRGPGSGHGKTAARGNKGMWSRSGSSQKRGFDGGQMPLHRRMAFGANASRLTVLSMLAKSHAKAVALRTLSVFSIMGRVRLERACAEL